MADHSAHNKRRRLSPPPFPSAPSESPRSPRISRLSSLRPGIIPKPIPSSIPHKPLLALKLPNARPHTPLKPVSAIKLLHPSQESQRRVKTISKTRIATTLDLDTEDGNMELSTLFLQSRHDSHSAPSSTTDSRILRGLQVSPNKSTTSRTNSHKFIFGGLAHQASMTFSRSKTTDTLWNTQIQSSNQHVKPDMRLSVIDVLPTPSARAILVKCVELKDKNELLALFPRTHPGSGDEICFNQNQQINVWHPWTTIRDVMFCTRFVVLRHDS